MLSQYLSTLGLSDKESRVYQVLAEVGVQPASVIARRCNLDRVTTYKHLKKLAGKGFLKTYSRNGVQCFGIENFDALQSYIDERMQLYRDLKQRFPVVSNVLRSLRAGQDVIPRLQMFEGSSGVKALFRDMLQTVKEQKLRQIRLLSSNTFEEVLSDEQMERTVRAFFRDMRDLRVHIDVFEVTGGMVPERLRRMQLSDVSKTSTLLTRGSTNIFLVGHAVYFASYKGAQIGLKITHRELSQILHFIFDSLERIAG